MQPVERRFDDEQQRQRRRPDWMEPGEEPDATQDDAAKADEAYQQIAAAASHPLPSQHAEPIDTLLNEIVGELPIETPAHEAKPSIDDLLSLMRTPK